MRVKSGNEVSVRQRYNYNTTQRRKARVKDSCEGVVPIQLQSAISISNKLLYFALYAFY